MSSDKALNRTTPNYYYKEEDVEKIFAALTAEIEECRKRFKKKQKSSFSLE